jgi:hypothetical protein
MVGSFLPTSRSFHFPKKKKKEKKKKKKKTKNKKKVIVYQKMRKLMS